MQEHTVIYFITVVGLAYDKIEKTKSRAAGQNENDIGEATLAIKN